MTVNPLPIPSAEEELILSRVIEDWPTRSPLQQAISLCVVRGIVTPDEVARNLGVKPEEVRSALKSLWGILWDQTRDHLYIK